MTDELFRKDSYLKECDAVVTAAEGRAVGLDRSVFYPLGGGQPGDTGSMSWPSGSARIVDTRYGESGEILHFVADESPLPPYHVGTMFLRHSFDQICSMDDYAAITTVGGFQRSAPRRGDETEGGQS